MFLEHQIIILLISERSCDTEDWSKRMLTVYEPVRALRSSNSLLLTVPHSRRKRSGDAAFRRYAPRLWNNLPEEVRRAKNINSFKSI